ncbi:MAG: S8 family serine peptidase [Candidatus Thermoplasmatota archaeon]|nr:S8 family serine peptidase [Candidatus Thermoplasmatota archaeon]
MARSRLAVGLVLLLLLNFAFISSPEDYSMGDSISIISESPIALEPDPDSIKGVSPTSFDDVSISHRNPGANTPVGSLSTNGWVLSNDVSEIFSSPREDLSLILLDSGIDPWTTRETISSLESVSVKSLIPPTGFLIQGNKEGLVAASSVSGIIATSSVPTALVVDESVRNTVESMNPEDRITVLITGWRDTSGDLHSTVQINEKTHDFSDLNVFDIRPWGDGRVEADVSIATIPILATNPSVAWISFPPQWEIHNDRSSGHMRVADTANAFISELNGSGITVAVADSGIDQDHGDMNGRITHVESMTWGDSSTEDRHSGHGTHVACTVLGDGSRGGYAGVAPKAELYFQAMEDDSSGQFSGASVDYMLRTAYNADVQIHTNSWGSQGDHGRYTTSAADVDSRTSQYDQFWSYDGFTVLYSAGNDGNTGLTPPATAKNSIAVANHHNRGGSAPDTISQTSSKGPTDDGRIKPDLAAPGSWVRSCLSQDAQDTGGNSWKSTWYIEYSGTSMAAPNAAGASALVHEYLTEIAGRPSPQGSLVKALLVLGAEDMGSRDIPNDSEGWGRINVANSLVPGTDVGIFVDDRNSLRSGNSATYEFNLTRSNSPLKVVLAWSDYQGSSSSSSQLRNNLDLEVVAPDGTTSYLGNNFQSGRSAPGGSPDATNNLEVVLVDSAIAGVWTVRVSDVYHGGGRSEQPYSIAVRGVNVNDLRSDPIVVLPDVSYSSEVPQVGEEMTISVPISNQGSGRALDLVVEAGILKVGTLGTDLGRQTVTIGPGVTRVLQWQWTPQDEGEVTLRINIDPDEAIEESDEDNNVANIPLIVSAPGIRVDVIQATQVVTSADQASSTWTLRIKNTALVPTNASMQSGPAIRDFDGTSFSWFNSFNRTSMPLEGSEIVDVTYTLVHPSPPDPGNYRITITGTDEDNNIQFPIDIMLVVPVLPDVQLQSTSSLVNLHPVDNTSFEVLMSNLGNGVQGYDLRIDAPQSWSMGFDELGSTKGASGGSTGTMEIGEQIRINMTAIPPSVMIAAGTSLTAKLVVTSQVDPTESWEIEIPLEVQSFDRLTARLDTQIGVVSKDATLTLQYTITNTGNQDVVVTPNADNRPSGWDLSSSLSPFNVVQGEEAIFGVAVTGNGFASSGTMQFQFVTEGGYSVSVPLQIQVQEEYSGKISFSSILLANGSIGTTPSSAGDVIAGPPGFYLEWLVENDGTTAWSGVYSLDVASGWNYECDSPGELSGGSSGYLTCNVIMPADVTPGSQPAIGAVVTAGDLSLLDIISIRVASTESASISWSEKSPTILVAGESNEVEVEIQNTGTAPFEHRVRVLAPEDWDVELIDSPIVSLNQQSVTFIDIRITPNNAVTESTFIRVEILGPDDAIIAAENLDLEVTTSSQENTDSGIGGIVFALAGLLMLFGTTLIVVFVIRNRTPRSHSFTGTLPPPPTSTESTNIPSVSCWACSEKIISSKRRACPSCGARYHLPGECIHAGLENCRRCGASSSTFVEE